MLFTFSIVTVLAESVLMKSEFIWLWQMLFCSRLNKFEEYLWPILSAQTIHLSVSFHPFWTFFLAFILKPLTSNISDNGIHYVSQSEVLSSQLMIEQKPLDVDDKNKSLMSSIYSKLFEFTENNKGVIGYISFLVYSQWPTHYC